MNMTEILDPAVRALGALAAVLFLLVATKPASGLRMLATFLLALAAAAFTASLSVAALLPKASALVNPDGSPGDPRLLTALVLGLAALTALLPAARAQRAPAAAQVGLWLPGVLVGGLVAAGGYIIGLKHPVAVTGLALGGFVAGAAISFAVRSRNDRALAAVAALAGGAGLVVVAAMSSLHGARAANLLVMEGTGADTLGTHLRYLRTEAPNDSLRRLRFAIGSAGRVDSTWVELRGAPTSASKDWRAGGAPFGGPLLVPTSVAESRANPHGITWMKKGESVEAGGARITFEKFRFEMGEPIRLYADLDVSFGGKSFQVHPGAKAHEKGEDPLTDEVPGFGPIAVAGVDADNGRVGLVLPTAVTSSVARVARVEVRLRPGLQIAWAGLAIALVALLLSFGAGRPAGTKAATN